MKEILDEMGPMLQKAWEEGYVLDDLGDNWWFFRRYPNRTAFSFTITLTHDNRLIMTGDLGEVIVYYGFHRSDGSIDYWPRKDTDIAYFAEKIRTIDKQHSIYTWDRDLALKDIEEIVRETAVVDLGVDGIKAEYVNTHTEEIMGCMDFSNQHEMMECLNRYDNTTRWYEYGIGKDYHPQVVWALHCMSYWAEFYIHINMLMNGGK